MESERRYLQSAKLGANPAVKEAESPITARTLGDFHNDDFGANRHEWQVVL